jgi:chemotaxis protein methyltransferase CheR
MDARNYMKHIGKTVISFFQNEFGFHFDKENIKRLEYLLANRMKKNGLTTEKNYLDFICSQKGTRERQLLVASFTVGETYFLRNSSHWNALRNNILPKIIKKKLLHNDTSLRIWSAGCSTGEESYSIAIMISENIPYYQKWNIEIMATDINESSLNHAKKGIYTENAFRETKDDFKNKYFSKNWGKYKIHSRFQQMITFEQINLISNGFPKHYSCFDIIFCRNVLMYFSSSIAERIVGNIYNTLNDKGYLFLGHAESHITKNLKFKPLSFDNAIVYQKQKKQPVQFCSKTVRVNQEPKQVQHHPFNYLKTETRNQYQNNLSSKNYFHEALNLYSIGKIDDAQNMLNKNAQNQTLYSLLLVGLIYIYKKDLEAAQIIFNEARMIHDLTPETYMLGAMIHEEMNRISEAIQGCRNAIFLDQTFFYPHFRLGEMYRNMGDMEQMQKSYQNALKILHVDHSNRFKLFCVGYNKEFLEDYLKSIESL